jgi:uncharacterized heparinase superfamily protein
MMSTLLRYWHTLRFLKPVQVYGRIAFRLARPAPDLRPPPLRRNCTGPWHTPPRRTVSVVGPARVRLLNQTREVLGPSAWSDNTASRLWLYNFHYFDDLIAAPDAARADWQRALLARWIVENPPASGPGWEPYPTSLRLVNCVKWLASGAAPVAGLEASLAVQARWLTQRLEHHLLGNHLFVNAKALCIAGLFFDGEEAARWRQTGLDLLARELKEQVHADGGHFEGSPMYHALFVEDLLDLINVATWAPGVVRDAAVESWREAASRMLSWLAAMTHPDGEISFFNDAAIGVAPSLAAVQAYASALGVAPAPCALSDSGYVRADRGLATVLMDAAPVGPDYQPGHAHADTLSFELSLGTQRVFVNSGTSTYAPGAQRDFERSTPAHNTVTVNGMNSSDVWGGFRVARRARAQQVRRVDVAGTPFVLTATHDGYRAEAGQPIHQRTWELTSQQLVVTDRCARARSAVARFHLHPSVQHAGDGTLRCADGREVRWAISGGDARMTASRWFPEFGVDVATLCLEVTFTGAECRTEFAWDD